MGTFTVIATGRLHPQALAVLKQHCELKYWDQEEAIPQALLYEWLVEADGIYNSGFTPINAALLQQGAKLRVVSQPSAGYDNIDAAACTARGVRIGNTPGALTETTADLAFALLLTAARRITQGWDMVRQGNWKKKTTIPFGIDLYGKTLGIVGMGAIGTAVARRARACGMNIIYHNRKPRSGAEYTSMRWVSFGELLGQSDCIVVLTPLTEQTRHMFDAAAFAKMKPTAYFVNAARGAIVDTAALYEALADQRIAYAALDVTDPEPLPADHPLLQLPNILITPHVGSATPETRLRMAMMAVDNLLAGLRNEPMPSCANSPC
ncbi:MAG: D-glycerate dehydrogenase [Sporomusaceae bacterium]|nr:D-glycerate dehydrogenase [Sporomusaceae bacterium]